MEGTLLPVCLWLSGDQGQAQAFHLWTPPTLSSRQYSQDWHGCCPGCPDVLSHCVSHLTQGHDTGCAQRSWASLTSPQGHDPEGQGSSDTSPGSPSMCPVVRGLVEPLGRHGEGSDVHVCGERVGSGVLT